VSAGESLSFQMLQGDAASVLRALPDESVNCCVTSPPYWGLRNYGTEPQAWGGNPSCDHQWGEWTERRDVREDANHGKSRTTERFYGDESRKFDGNHQKHTAGAFCADCGAWRGELGNEHSPELYIEHLTELFREVRRVLRGDGTLWLNLGDSYCTNPGNLRGGGELRGQASPVHRSSMNKRGDGLKPKDLIGIPWMAAFALRSDGWWLRSDIIWHKPNAMPSSVTDRPTSAHEYLFLLSKSSRYHYDHMAIREPAKYPGDYGFLRGPVDGCDSDKVSWRAKSQQDRKNGGVDSHSAGDEWRSKRSVWTVATQPTPEAHFATYPIALIEPCILAGCPEGGTVLDPFAGSGTTGLAALKHGRKFLGIELNPEYIEIANGRVNSKMPLFAQAEGAA
jgi:DNA modification methylase